MPLRLQRILWPSLSLWKGSSLSQALIHLLCSCSVRAASSYSIGEPGSGVFLQIFPLPSLTLSFIFLQDRNRADSSALLIWFLVKFSLSSFCLRICNADKLDIKDEKGIRLDCRACAAFAVSQIRMDVSDHFASDLHVPDSFSKPRDEA